MFRKKISNLYYQLSIQIKLILVFLFTTLIIFSINIYINLKLNQIAGSIDQIYTANISLNDLQSELGLVRGSVTEYLNSKSSDSLESYYRHEQNYNLMIEELNAQVTQDEILLMEKNIRGISDQYLLLSGQAVEAKRGRNIQKYKMAYEEAEQLYEYLNTMIYSLNNKQFQRNSVNYETFLASLKYSERINMGILILAGLLNCMLMVLLTRGITRPLKKLADAANQVAEGNLEIEIKETKTKDEVYVVTKAFNQMVRSLQEYIAKLRQSMEAEAIMKENELRMESHLKDAQLKYLQAQINPHFLYNTLNAGAQLAMMEDAEKSYQYIQNVADFFRYMLKQNKDVVSLKEEIKLIDSYIYILNVRFGGEIHFYKEVDENYADIPIPIMTLQPIVENAVNYGIRGIEWEGKINLSVYAEADGVCIRICDNGIGISQQKIDDIMNNRLQEKKLGDNSNGIGLGNVMERLRLFYNASEIFEISSAGENLGTEVIIHIPRGEVPLTRFGGKKGVTDV